MLPYCLFKPFVFALDPETAHYTAIKALRLRGALLPSSAPPKAHAISLMGLQFPNRIGLAAGFDKNAEAIEGLATLGFGFIEVGTVTPRPQAGNAKPRLFRLPEAGGIINRMGFNNVGAEALVRNVAAARYKGVLGVNIGKNADTPVERAAEDYLLAMDKVYACADYITINISSPNTKNLRQLQESAELEALLAALKLRQAKLAQQQGKYVPLALKIAPDLTEAQIGLIADAVRKHRIEALIATNTTLGREGVLHLQESSESGGLSGKPLFEKSTAVLRAFAARLGNEVPLIAAGGVDSAEAARTKFAAGASLVQLYSGLIYQGPELVRACINDIEIL